MYIQLEFGPMHFSVTLSTNT